ncbi:MAG: VOC family protein, partial [Acidimicrobiia bacterium]
LVGAPSDHGGLWDPADPDRGAPPAFEPGAGALPGFRGFERLQITVADLDEASAVFEDVLGFEACGDVPAPADEDGLPLRASANVDARARPSCARVLRSPFLNLELVECPPFPGQRTLWPAMFDVGGWHLAFYVDDVDAAYARLERCDVHLLGAKKPSYHDEAGVDAYTVHCLAPFGLLFELVTYPHGRDGEATRTTSAWHPGHPTR